jgi:hypothetical protein
MQMLPAGRARRMDDGGRDAAEAAAQCSGQARGRRLMLVTRAVCWVVFCQNYQAHDRPGQEGPSESAGRPAGQSESECSVCG